MALRSDTSTGAVVTAMRRVVERHPILPVVLLRRCGSLRRRLLHWIGRLHGVCSAEEGWVQVVGGW